MSYWDRTDCTASQGGVHGRNVSSRTPPSSFVPTDATVITRSHVLPITIEHNLHVPTSQRHLSLAMMEISVLLSWLRTTTVGLH